MNESLLRISKWFHADGEAHGLAALRIAFGLYGIWMLWDLYPRRQLLYGEDGLYGALTLAASSQALGQSFWTLQMPGRLDLILGAFLLASVAMVLGVASRGAVILAFACHVLLDTRNGFANYGADSVYRHLMFWLMFAQSGRVWSVDAWRNPQAVTTAPLWPLRAMQLQVACIYLLTGYFKLKTEVWADGSAVYYALHTPGMQTYLTSWMIEQRSLSIALTYGTLLFELTFAVGVFTSYRYLYLLGGVMLHLGIDLFMMIRLFSFAMFASYLSYLEPSDWERLRKGVARIRIPRDLTRRAALRVHRGRP